MTKEMLGVGMTCAATFLSAAGFLFAAQQSSPGPPTKSAGQKQTSKATPDNWQKMKDCAAQADKIIAERNERSVSVGGLATTSWRNHYSPKYNRCFLQSTYYIFLSKDFKDQPKWSPLDSVTLMDAFERLDIARYAPPRMNIAVACAEEKDPDGCKRISTGVLETLCQVGGHAAECDEAKAFIEEHMKN